MLTIVRAVETSIGAPNQWDAWTDDGAQLYLRYRHARGRVEDLHGAIVGHWRDDEDLFYDLPGFCARSGILRLAEDADITPYDLTEASMALDTPAPPLPDTPPVPLFRGRVSIFSTPDGSLLIAYRPEGEKEDRREVIPAVALGMAGQFAAMFGGGQNPLSLMTRLAGG